MESSLIDLSYAMLRMMDREPDLPAEASIALGGLAALILLVAHLCGWFFLMLGRPDGGYHRTTVWTFIFFAPEAVLAVGIGAAAAVRRPGGRIFAALWLGAVAALILVIYFYAALPARRWSLPVVPPFGGGSR
jgi:uncharacterized membrane protein